MDDEQAAKLRELAKDAKTAVTPYSVSVWNFSCVASPDVLLALLDERDALRRERDALRRERDEARDSDRESVAMYQRCRERRDDAMALLRRAREALDEAGGYVNSPCMSPSMLDECERVVRRIDALLGDGGEQA